MAELVNQVISTLSDAMQFIAPNAGGSVPDATSEEYSAWRMAIQTKYEEAARRGFWRRLLVKDDTLTVREGDESVVLPIQFQRANALYIFAMNGEDLADPDRVMDDDSQTIFLQQITDPDDEDFGLWQANFKYPIEEDLDIILWYFALPPKPVDPTDKFLLPGDMIAYGAMSEIFRTSNLEGSQDDARIEYENRFNTYIGLEVIPPRNELLFFSPNPGRINRTALARAQYSGGRSGRRR
jgi:hypothetical protein